MKTNSEVIKKLRIAKGWSQEQLGEASGLSLRTIQRLENGGNAAIESVRALAAALDVDPNDLISIEKDEKPVNMKPFDAVKMGFLNFANFSDTATRFEYWWFFLFVVLLMAVATVIHEKAYQVVTLIVLLPFLAAGARRLNDAGHSLWWLLFFFVPFGQIVVLCYLALPSSNPANQLEKQGFDVA
jgi:transcriptional regulator with XRE-family HTH domain